MDRWTSDLDVDIVPGIPLPQDHVHDLFALRRVDHAAIRRSYLQVDGALATALKAAVKTLVAQLVPADVQAHPAKIRELAVPAAWRERVQAEVRRALTATWREGAASARAELARGSSRRFGVEDEPRDDKGRWVDDPNSNYNDAYISVGHDRRGILYVLKNDAIETAKASEIKLHGQKWRGAEESMWRGRYDPTQNIVTVLPPTWIDRGKDWQKTHNSPRLLPYDKTSNRVPADVLGKVLGQFPGATIAYMFEDKSGRNRWRVGGRLYHLGFDLSPQDLPEWIDTLAYNLTQSLGADVVKALRAIWANALAQDWSVGKLQEVLAGALAGYQDSSGQDITPARIATIVRTTNTNAFNQARMDVFSDPSLDGFVEALEYSAILDDRTTPLCEYLDGRTYALDDEFWTDYMPPNHFNCRSLAIPVVQGDDWEQSDPPKAGMEPADGFSV